VRFVSSLKSKIILSVSAILAVIIGTGTWINIGYQRAQMESALEDNVLIISNTIEKSLANAMLDGKSKEVQHILEAVGTYHNIRELRIFSPNGVILKSSKRSLIGRKIDAATQKLFLAGEFNRPIKRREAGVFSVLFPIANTEQCVRCHGTQAALNGILAVDVSMVQTQEKVGELSKTMILWAFGITATLALSLGLFLTRFVTDPIQELITTMERAERGLEARVQVKSSDDIGLLGEAFNSLLSKLERARRRVERYHYEQMKRADRLASIGEMAAGIAHEIKNPLVGIRGAAQLMKADRTLAAGTNLTEYLDVILKEADRLNGVLEGILDFTRLKPLSSGRFNIHAVLDRALLLQEENARQKGVVLAREYDPSLPEVTGNQDQLLQVFLNLVKNAIEAMPSGGKLTAVTRMSDLFTSVQADGRKHRLMVAKITDTGCGIKQEHLQEIFAPFFTTKDKGVGLGLALSYQIVQEHLGTVRVESAEGAGTTFSVYLPLAGKDSDVRRATSEG